MCWDGLGRGGRLDFDRQLGSWAAVGRAPPPARPPIPAGSRRKRGWGQLHRETFVLARTDTGWGPSFPLAATETGAT